MGSLTFVGLGLHDARDVSLKGLDAIRAADVVFLESYTSRLAGASASGLERMYGKEITALGRERVEQGDAILEAARRGNVVVLVAGDPMAATTHVDLRLRAARSGIPTRIVHGASIIAAVPGLLGLQGYKFGRTTTLAFPHGGQVAESPYEVVAANLARGLHTLVLLDLDAERGRFMTANEGLGLLLEVARRRSGGPVGPATLACVVARAGSEEPFLRAGPMAELAKEDFGPPLHTIVVPGELHFLEEEALRVFAGMGASLGD